MNFPYYQTFPQQLKSFGSLTATPAYYGPVSNMAATYSSDLNHQQVYHQPLSVDTKHGQAAHGFFDEDNVLDENVLDNSALDSGLEMSPHMVDSRRDSFAIGGPGLISPTTKAEDWHSSVEMQSLPSNNPWYDQPQQQSNNPFAQGAQFPMQSQGWNFNGEYVGNMMMPAQASYPNHTNIFAHLAAGSQSQSHGQSQNHQQQSQTPSPQEESSVNGRAKPTRPVSPNNLRAKGDGIRKKNARFPIPENHTLQNIDRLISEETDEKKLKELKGHKRLLRNRQAALDSRQRKKQHTERLEDEKKQYSEVVSMQEAEIEQLKQDMATMALERQQYVEYVHKLQLEKDEMIAAHTNEAGELRRKISVLSDHVQRLESNPATATASNSNDFAFGDMNDLSMGSWDHTTFMNDFSVEHESKQEVALVKKEPAESEKTSQQGGLLFMLFLVGAFVLSNKSPAPIPRVSDDVRAASATLLDNVLKDAGISNSQTSVQPLAPQPSGAWTNPSTGISMNDVNMDDSVLGQLGNTLTQPTQEQSNEQLFGLSAAQYNDVNADFVNTAQPQPSEFLSQGRRNLNDALAALRVSGSKAQGAADVYTRSLLWDQIPQDIVRDFARMMQSQRGTANTHAQTQNQQQQQQCSNDIS